MFLQSCERVLRKSCSFWDWISINPDPKLSTVTGSSQHLHISYPVFSPIGQNNYSPGYSSLWVWRLGIRASSTRWCLTTCEGLRNSWKQYSPKKQRQETERQPQRFFCFLQIRTAAILVPALSLVSTRLPKYQISIWFSFYRFSKILKNWHLTVLRLLGGLKTGVLEAGAKAIFTLKAWI